MNIEQIAVGIKDAHGLDMSDEAAITLLRHALSKLAEQDVEIGQLNKPCQIPVPPDVSAQIERTDWSPEQALQFYADQHNFDIVEGHVRIIDNGAVASNALKHLSLTRLELKGDAELTELREQLVASQAREQLTNECRIALVHQIHELADHIERAEYCIDDIDMLKQMRGQRAYAMKVASRWNQNGNPFSDDTTALEAMIAKAVEVMRERCAKACTDRSAETDADAFDEWDQCNYSCAEAIRAIPSVTLEDIK